MRDDETDRPAEAEDPPAAQDAESVQDPPEAPAADDLPASETDELSSPEPEQPPAPRPLLDARGLGLRLRSGWVFRHMDVRATAGESVELVGSGGTGRSMLLLALVGRARHTDGDLDVLGTGLRPGWHGAAQARAVRRRTAVARIGPAVELDDQLTVAQSVSDRRRWDGAAATYDEAVALVGLELHGSTLVELLSAVDRTLLAVALALMAPHEVLVLDDADVGLSSEEHLRVGEALADVASTGVAVLSSAARPSGAARAVVVPVHAHQPVHAAQEAR
ncbi:ATP-binding cassette domain-containing protein [Cellulomonas sp. JH27-2]|uniref:ATP-binding cassette domain-containing protein n=1 Tax=Cellulomonas sp. JH27-2 TaxID=2774139 RepID=UPI00177ED798|nr:ATP-binding cassette domain-containing protein [Cellulomonas sp. JH27-2]MBD8058506.1 ATP-binding cassette domain-containing protein [Cellulomonas sp. JH27-2]